MRNVRGCFVILVEISKDFGRFQGRATEVDAKQQLFAWSLVHGYAQLLTANRFKKDDKPSMNILDIIPDLQC
jgi:hypothetical protein